MTHATFLEESVPLHFQCLCVPVEWRRAIKQPKNNLRSLLALMSPPQREEPEFDGDFLEVERVFPDATSRLASAKKRDLFLAQPFDPWEKRSEFFRLRKDDTEALLAFLGSVGLFEQPMLGEESATASKATLSAPSGLLHEISYRPKISPAHIWGMRRLIEGSLQALDKHTAKYQDFQMRIEHTKDGQARLMLTTATFLDALLLTLSVDQLENAKVQKCARPDCGVSFSIRGGHERKYCTWYCGHIESVRRSRKKMQKRKGVKRGK
jgi:hypothetical protein